MIEQVSLRSSDRDLFSFFLNFVMYLRSESRLFNVKILSLNYCRIKEINGGRKKCSFRNCFSWKEMSRNIYNGIGRRNIYKIGDKLKNSSHSIDSVTFPFLFLYLKFNLSRKLICRKGDLNILRIIYQLEILTF